MLRRLALFRAGIGPQHTSRNLALRREATDLFGDISKARFLIDRLHQRYLAGVEAPELSVITLLAMRKQTAGGACAFAVSCGGSSRNTRNRQT